ncbi:MAG TPA: aldose 1-epimerase family protein [Jatrophihabitans sp.]|uniref:aldose 1-epimerase family protein n=1 Tax=Jatrophihabitans sp. TaxID=1932789 RepID=UPI002DFAB70D|nr:aldose 1-epimerase family protein [Jatrophihabitans sp.]
MTLSGQEFTITSGEHAATIVEVGAGLRSYTVGGVPITCTYGDDVLPPKGCGATLVPWPNRIRGGRYTFEGKGQQLALTEPAAGNAIHGLGRWARWSLVQHLGERVTLGLDVVPQNGYPFPVRVETTYAVDATHGLMVTIGARNLGSRRAPFGAGSHPYLSTRGHAIDDVTLTVPARETLVVDDKQVPIGSRTLTGKDDFRRGRRLHATRLDHGFTGLDTPGGRGVAEIRTKSGGAQLWFDETFGFLQVFTVDALTEGQPGIAVEPMTCAPDAFNSGAGLIVLEPGGAWTGSWGIVPV